MISPPFIHLLLGVVGLVVLGSILVAGREFHTAYRVLSTPTGRVSELLTDAAGVIELHGTAQIGEKTLTVPFTGAECLLVETVVEEYESGQHGGSWNEIDSMIQSVSFLLEDGSESVLVDPRRAEVRVDTDTERIEVDGGSVPPDRVQAYIEENDEVSCENSQLDLRLFSIPTGSDRRYIERRLRPGGEVYALGHVRAEAGRAGSVNAVVGDGPGTRPVIADRSPRATGLRAIGRGGLYLVPGLLAGIVCLLVLVA